MFKYISQPAICCMLMMVVFTSCKEDSFLDIVPKGQQIAKTTSDYNLLMNSNTLYFYNGGNGWQLPLAMGDEIVAEATDFNSIYVPQLQRAFRYEADVYDIAAYSYDISQPVQNLYLCNTVIKNVAGSAGGSEQQKDILKAEAIATRAWIHFQMINFYGKPYNAATAATDPGFPIINTADVSQAEFPRKSVQEVYDFIISDLKAAIEVLPISSSFRTRMNKPAAEGILGKVYLFMGKSDLALPLLNAALQHNNGNPNGARLYNYNVTFGPGGSFLPIGPSNGPNGPGNNYDDFTESLVSKVFYTGPNNGSFQNSGMVIDTSTFRLLYGVTTDHRIKFYAKTTPSNAVNPSGRYRKYGIQWTRFGMELADLYLLSAEAKARTNDLAGAKADVETLRGNRMPSADAIVPAAIAGNQSELIKFIIDERLREYALQGYRWFDMRRLSVDPLFTGKTYVHKLFNANGTVTTYTLDQSKRFVLRFPQPFITTNNNMPDNP